MWLLKCLSGSLVWERSKEWRGKARVFLGCFPGRDAALFRRGAVTHPRPSQDKEEGLAFQRPFLMSWCKNMPAFKARGWREMNVVMYIVR